MSNKTRIVEALKQKLKAEGLTYALLSRRMNVSEATIKRYLSQGRFTLDTLDAMCAALDTSIEELLEQTRPCGNDRSFSMEQEQALAENDLLFAIFYLVGGGWGFRNIVEHFGLSEVQLTKLLLQLDRQALLDYRSNDDIRLMKAMDTPWRTSGPLWIKYKRAAVLEFFQSDFSAPHELLRVTPGPVSPETAVLVRRKLLQVQREISDLMALDRSSGVREPEVERYWFVTAMRPMSFSALGRTAVEAGACSVFGDARPRVPSPSVNTDRG
ncbi:MAG: helix-turn-helix transcriptional regulator [Polyangiaceae bacterium]|nr:helix-turn-helix transcriptional regulator [Polyangiaceae bacterium]